VKHTSELFFANNCKFQGWLRTVQYCRSVFSD